MNDTLQPAVNALDIEARTGSSYPEPFRKAVQERTKRALGDYVGLTHYGVNLVELMPGCWSSQRHWHTHEDELVYVLSGSLMLVTDDAEQQLTAGMVTGFPAGRSNGHHLVNRSDSPATYLEIGDRVADDSVYYPDIDLQLVSGENGHRQFTHRDGRPYD